jgi:hypothetical protein
VAEIEVADTDATVGWVADFGSFTVTWPNHFSLASPDVSGAPFELWGERGSGTRRELDARQSRWTPETSV